MSGAEEVKVSQHGPTDTQTRYWEEEADTRTRMATRGHHLERED